MSSEVSMKSNAEVLEMKHGQAYFTKKIDYEGGIILQRKIFYRKKIPWTTMHVNKKFCEVS